MYHDICGSGSSHDHRYHCRNKPAFPKFNPWHRVAGISNGFCHCTRSGCGLWRSGRQLEPWPMGCQCKLRLGTRAVRLGGLAQVGIASRNSASSETRKKRPGPRRRGDSEFGSWYAFARASGWPARAAPGRTDGTRACFQRKNWTTILLVLRVA